MALIFCKECKNKISAQAKSCPQCGAPQKKFNAWVLIILLSIVLIGVAYFYWPSQNEKVVVAREILLNNRDDLSDIATKQIKQTWLRIGAKFVINNRCDCIIDSLAPKLAAKHSLEELNELKGRATSTIVELTELVNENQEICKDCLLFRK